MFCDSSDTWQHGIFLSNATATQFVWEAVRGGSDAGGTLGNPLGGEQTGSISVDDVQIRNACPGGKQLQTPDYQLSKLIGKI